MPKPENRLNDAVVAVALVYPAVYTWVYFVALADAAPGLQWTAGAIGKIVQFSFPLAWVLLVLRERPRLQPPDWRGIVEGLLFGAAVFAAMLALYHLWLKPSGFFAGPASAVREKLMGLRIDGLGKFIALGAFYSLVHSLLEEYYWRWFAFGQLARRIAWPLAVLISSLAFMAHHVLVLGVYFGWTSPATWLFSSAVAIGGAYWAWLYRRTGSLWGPWLSHLVIDAAIFTLGYDLAGPF